MACYFVTQLTSICACVIDSVTIALVLVVSPFLYRQSVLVCFSLLWFLDADRPYPADTHGGHSLSWPPLRVQKGSELLLCSMARASRKDRFTALQHPRMGWLNIVSFRCEERWQRCLLSTTLAAGSKLQSEQSTDSMSASKHTGHLSTRCKPVLLSGHRVVGTFTPKQTGRYSVSRMRPTS